jgi:hypothetical protein
MVVVAALEADIMPGDFIVVKWHDSSNVVCNVRCIVLPHSLEVVWWRVTNNAPSVCPLLGPRRVKFMLMSQSPQLFLVIL